MAFDVFPYSDLHSLNLDWILKQVKQMGEKVDAFSETFLKQANAYTDQKIVEATANLREELDSFEVNITRQQGAFESSVNGAIANINARVEELNEAIQANFLAMQAYTTSAIEQNNIVIFDKIGQGLLDVRVINIFTGEKVTIQQMFDYLANFHLTNAISVSRIGTLQKTINTVISYGTVDGKTCTDLVTNGYAIFGA